MALVVVVVMVQIERRERMDAKEGLQTYIVPTRVDEHNLSQ